MMEEFVDWMKGWNSGIGRRETAGIFGMDLYSMHTSMDAVLDYLRDVDPSAFPKQPDDEIIESLTQVWGIGVWSAQMHLMFSLGRLDVWPVLDLGVRNGWAKFTGDAAPTHKELEPMGEPYRPYRSVVAWYMWRVHDLGDKWVG